jgi:hypothetical protein
MVVLAFVRHNEHLRLIHAPLDVLPRRAAPNCAAFIVAPAFGSSDRAQLVLHVDTGKIWKEVQSAVDNEQHVLAFMV